jgi:hypothetical protein
MRCSVVHQLRVLSDSTSWPSQSPHSPHTHAHRVCAHRQRRCSAEWPERKTSGRSHALSKVNSSYQQHTKFQGQRVTFQGHGSRGGRDLLVSLSAISM